MRTNHAGVTEVAHLRTNLDKYYEEYDRIFNGRSPYVDKYGQWHVKPCPGGEPSGNDGLIVSAYAFKAGLSVSNLDQFYASLKGRNEIPVERLPGKEHPYPSRDFFLGAVFFNLCGIITSFSPIELPSLNPFKLIKQLWALRGKHRNTFWQESGYEQVYHVAFMVPLQDRAFYYECYGMSAPLVYRFIAWIDSKLKPSGDSSTLIRWLKYDQMPDVGVFERYFGEDHPITLEIKKECPN